MAPKSQEPQQDSSKINLQDFLGEITQTVKEEIKEKKDNVIVAKNIKIIKEKEPIKTPAFTPVEKKVIPKVNKPVLKRYTVDALIGNPEYYECKVRAVIKASNEVHAENLGRQKCRDKIKGSQIFDFSIKEFEEGDIDFIGNKIIYENYLGTVVTEENPSLLNQFIKFAINQYNKEMMNDLWEVRFNIKIENKKYLQCVQIQGESEEEARKNFDLFIKRNFKKVRSVTKVQISQWTQTSKTFCEEIIENLPLVEKMKQNESIKEESEEKEKSEEELAEERRKLAESLLNQFEENNEELMEMGFKVGVSKDNKVIKVMYPKFLSREKVRAMTRTIKKQTKNWDKEVIFEKGI